MDRHLSWRQWALLAILSILWGGSFFFIEVAVVSVRPLTLVFARLLGAALVLTSVVALSKHHMPANRVAWRQLFVLGFLNNALPFCLIVWSQTRISAGEASVLNATTPIFTVVVAHFLTSDERLTLAKSIGAGLGVLGVAVVVGQDIATQSTTTGAKLAVLVAACSYACAGVYGRRLFRSEFSPLAIAAGQVIASTVMLLPVLLFHNWGSPASIWTYRTVAATVGLAVFSTAAAYVIYFSLLQHIGATHLLLVTLLIPVSATLLGTLFLGEQLVPQAVVGMCVIACGILTIDGRVPKRLKKVPS